MQEEEKYKKLKTSTIIMTESLKILIDRAIHASSRGKGNIAIKILKEAKELL